ncbi:hypothetical protein GCM10027569_11030 [Flindersiella endophytica]
MRAPAGYWPKSCRAEVDAYIAAFADERDEHGHRLVVRNGYHQPREVLTSAGVIAVTAPRVNDKRTDPDAGERKLCLLVMIGVRADGRKELVALADGYRESTESWAICCGTAVGGAWSGLCWPSATGRWGSGAR